MLAASKRRSSVTGSWACQRASGHRRVSAVICRESVGEVRRRSEAGIPCPRSHRGGRPAPPWPVERSPRGRPPEVARRARTVGIVEPEQCRLGEGIGRTEARRMVGIALEFRRAPDMRLSEHRLSVSARGEPPWRRTSAFPAPRTRALRHRAQSGGRAPRCSRSDRQGRARRRASSGRRGVPSVAAGKRRELALDGAAEFRRLGKLFEPAPERFIGLAAVPRCGCGGAAHR